VRRYLALVLGHIEDREALPLLTEAASDDDSRVRIYSLWAIGALADPSTLPTLKAAMSDEDPGIRKTVAFALGGFESDEVLETLSVLVQDPVADVRWNASRALAQIGSDRGVAVLEQMLDRRLLAQIPGITESQQIEAMLSALGALARIPEHADRDLIERLAEDDPSLKVRQGAIVARRVLDSSLGEAEGKGS